jgi:hypothetical protein
LLFSKRKQMDLEMTLPRVQSWVDATAVNSSLPSLDMSRVDWPASCEHQDRDLYLVFIGICSGLGVGLCLGLVFGIVVAQGFIQHQS